MRWSVPVLNDLNGVLLNYSFTYFGIEIDTVPRVIYLSNPGFGDQTLTLTNLEEYTTYSINVSSYTKVGKGPDAIIKERTNQDGEFSFLAALVIHKTAMLLLLSSQFPLLHPLHFLRLPSLLAPSTQLGNLLLLITWVESSQATHSRTEVWRETLL